MSLKIAVALGAVVTSAVVAQKPRSNDHLLMRPDNFTWQWTTTPWTGSDEAFKQVTREVDFVEARKGLTLGYVQRVQALAQQAPTDARTQFRWGYAVLRAPYVGIKLGRNNYHIYTPVVRALQRPKAANSYQFSRLKFLLMSLRYEHPQLKVVGARLLRRNPQDTPIKSQMVFYLAGSRKPQERKVALQYAQELVRGYPRWPGAYNALGWVYSRALVLYGDLSAADKGIAAYQKYLQLVGPRSTEREAGLFGIRRLRTVKARQMREGFKPPTNIIRS